MLMIDDEADNASINTSKSKEDPTTINKLIRELASINSETKRLGIGQRGKLGGPGDGRAGIVEFDGSSAEAILEEAKRMYRIDYERDKGVPFTEGKTYPSRTWFTYIEKRRPLLLIYLIDIDADGNQKAQVDQFKAQMNDIPVVGFALGLPRNDSAAKHATKYKANKFSHQPARMATFLRTLAPLCRKAEFLPEKGKR